MFGGSDVAIYKGGRARHAMVTSTYQLVQPVQLARSDFVSEVSIKYDQSYYALSSHNLLSVLHRWL